MPDETNETEKEPIIEYPNVIERFREVFKKLGIKKADAFVDHAAKGDLEDLVGVERSLYELGLHPSLRHQVISFWAGELRQPVPAALQRRLSDDRGIKGREGAAEAERDREKYSVDTESGAIKVATTTDKTALTWDEAQNLASTIKKELTEKGKARAPTYVYDTETRQVRMAKESEIGGTLEQAKELKKMGEDVKKEEVESPFIQNTEGNWILNPKARITGVEFMALEAIKRAQEKGEAVDPLEQLAQTAEKMRVYQEAFGGGARKMPDWMSDPAKFIEMVRTISGGGDRGMPEWMSDPARFIEMIRTISGGGKGDEAVEKQLAELRQTIDTMREEKLMGIIASQQQQIQASTEGIRKLGDRVEELGRPVTGRTEMDVIHEVATTGLGLAQTELGGLRRDLKDILSSSALPTAKTPEQRDDRKKQYRKGLARDENIEKLGRSLFFGEGNTPATSEVEVKSKVPQRQASAETYIYDRESKQIRTAQEGEVGITLEQAKMAKTGDSLLFE